MSHPRRIPSRGPRLCPACGARGRVLAARLFGVGREQHHNRRLSCPQCERRWTTVERIAEDQ